MSRKKQTVIVHLPNGSVIAYSNVTDFEELIDAVPRRYEFFCDGVAVQVIWHNIAVIEVK